MDAVTIACLQICVYLILQPYCLLSDVILVNKPTKVHLPSSWFKKSLDLNQFHASTLTVLRMLPEVTRACPLGGFTGAHFW